MATKHEEAKKRRSQIKPLLLRFFVFESFARLTQMLLGNGIDVFGIRHFPVSKFPNLD
jgi:hypothetical protein